MSDVTLRFVARSEIGKVRRNNEDSGYASSNLLVVADGMGGHEAGELASAATVGAIVSSTTASSEADEVLDLLANAVVTSGEYIADVVARNRELAGMGTTLTALALRNERIAIAHVGDSRAYLLRDGELQQLTKDHTFVQTLVDAGQITREEAAVHPRRNLMMRAIDGIHAVEVDLSVREARVGDRYLLCSDGLCGVIEDGVIAEHLGAEDLTVAVTGLIDAVMDSGAPDNITVIVAELEAGSTTADAVVLGAAADPEAHRRLPGVDIPAEPQAAIRLPAGAADGRRIRVRAVAATVGVVIALLSAGVGWLSHQWYVGTYTPTQVVAVYQGIPVAGLSRIIEVSAISVASLPTFERAEVTATIGAASKAEADAIVAQLSLRAATCKAAPSTPGCPP